MKLDSAPRICARIVLSDGTVLLKELYSRDAQATLRDYYHLLLDEMGDDYSLFPNYADWLRQTAAEHDLEDASDLERLLTALTASGTLESAPCKT